MKDSNINLTPSDLVGVVQRSLSELHGYMQQPVGSIDFSAVSTHLDRIQQIVAVLQGAQVKVENGNDAAEARAN